MHHRTKSKYVFGKYIEIKWFPRQNLKDSHIIQVWILQCSVRKKGSYFSSRKLTVQLWTIIVTGKFPYIRRLRGIHHKTREHTEFFSWCFVDSNYFLCSGLLDEDYPEKKSVLFLNMIIILIIRDLHIYILFD